MNNEPTFQIGDIVSFVHPSGRIQKSAFTYLVLSKQEKAFKLFSFSSGREYHIPINEACLYKKES